MLAGNTLCFNFVPVVEPRGGSNLGFKIFKNSEGKTVELKFEGSPAQCRKQIEEYLGISAVMAGELSHQQRVPENVTRQVIYEFVESSTSRPFRREYYAVTLVNDTIPVACTCKDFHYSIRKKKDRGDRNPTHTCKHMRMARERHRQFR